MKTLRYTFVTAGNHEIRNLLGTSSISGVRLHRIFYNNALGFLQIFMVLKEIFFEQVQCADISKKYSYMELASATYGKSMTLFVKLTFFICNWGFVVAFIVLVKKIFFFKEYLKILIFQINKLLAHASAQFFPTFPDFMSINI